MADVDRRRPAKRPQAHTSPLGSRSPLAAAPICFPGVRGVPAQGFEPWTLGLKGRCSARLSYTGVGCPSLTAEGTLANDPFVALPNSRGPTRQPNGPWVLG